MTAAELLSRHPREWAAATGGPFLDAVRDGSLPEPAFRRWLGQDYLFVAGELGFQARLLSLAPSAGRALLTEGLVALEAELTWFKDQAQRLHVSLEVEPDAVTARYGRLLDAGWSSWPPGITTLWACERAYLDAWSGAAPGASAYRDFVVHWTQPGFAEYVARLEALVDAAGADERAFLDVCELERDFWRMAWDSVTS